VRSPVEAGVSEQTPTRVRGPAEPGTEEIFPMPFGDYSLVRRIGKGGMAVVYEARRRGEERALKRPLAGFLDDDRFRERFLREAELGRALHHPNIIRIFDRGEVGETPYFAMELVRGETLSARLDREGRLDIAPATRLTAQVAEALDYAHNKGVIHRDLKPSNIMIEPSGAVKVMDYGIARAQHMEGLTTTGAFLGTPSYVAPETVESTSQPASDLYSLGVVLFEMLTGSLPFGGDTAFAVLRNHCTTPPPAPSSLNYALPAELDRLVLRLLSKDPSERPTAEELRNELSEYLVEEK
jgi:serine/threonine protein kinase